MCAMLTKTKPIRQWSRIADQFTRSKSWNGKIPEWNFYLSHKVSRVWVSLGLKQKSPFKLLARSRKGKGSKHLWSCTWAQLAFLTIVWTLMPAPVLKLRRQWKPGVWKSCTVSYSRDSMNWIHCQLQYCLLCRRPLALDYGHIRGSLWV